jgi:hypothetical protein
MRSLFYFYFLFLLSTFPAFSAPPDSSAEKVPATTTSESTEETWALTIMRPNYIGDGPLLVDVEIDGEKVAILPNNSYVVIIIRKNSVNLRCVVERLKPELSALRHVNPLDTYVGVSAIGFPLQIYLATKEEFDRFLSSGEIKQFFPIELPIEYERDRVEQLSMHLENCLGRFDFYYKEAFQKANEFYLKSQTTREQVDVKIVFGERILKDFSDGAYTGRMVWSSVGLAAGAGMIVGGLFIPVNFVNSGELLVDNLFNLGAFFIGVIKLFAIGGGIGITLGSFLNYFFPSQREREYSAYKKWLEERQTDAAVSIAPFFDINPAGMVGGIRVSF